MTQQLILLQMCECVAEVAVSCRAQSAARQRLMIQINYVAHKLLLAELHHGKFMHNCFPGLLCIWFGHHYIEERRTRPFQLARLVE